MKKLELRPHRKSVNDSARVLNVIVHDYWYRSAMGFGSYEKQIAQNTFKRVAGNCKLYYTVDPDGNKYRAKAVQMGKGFYLVIKPMEKVELR